MESIVGGVQRRSIGVVSGKWQRATSRCYQASHSSQHPASAIRKLNKGREAGANGLFNAAEHSPAMGGIPQGFLSSQRHCATQLSV